MELHFEINLQRMSMLATALALWDRKDVKLKVKEFFYTNKGFNTQKKWICLVKEVVKEFKQGFIPNILYCQLLYVIRDIGLKIYGWFRYIKKTRLFGYTSRKEIFDIYSKNLVWTHYGTIDEIKTLRSWMNEEKVDYCKAYSMACRCCLVEDIKKLWNLIPEHVKSSRFKDAYYRYGTTIVAYWWSYQDGLQDNFLTKLIDMDQTYLNLYDEASSLDENMLTLSARKQYRLAVEHFWNKLSDEKKQRNIFKCLMKSLQTSKATYSNCRKYRTEQCAEVILFFLNQLTKDSKKEFFLSREYRVLSTDEVFPINGVLSNEDSSNEAICEIFDTLLFMWPWQELLVPVLEYLSDFLTIHEYKSLFTLLSWKMLKAYNFGLPVKNGLYQRSFFDLWQIVPSNFKLKISKSIIKSLFQVWDISNINMIINDEEVVEERLNLLSEGYEKFFSLVKDKDNNDNNVMISQFVKGTLIPIKWDQTIKQNLRILYDLIMNEDEEFVLHEKFLKFGFKSEEEEENIYKEKLNIDVLCYYFVGKNKLNQANELLFWKFNNNKEKIKDYKSRLFNPTVEKVHIWYTENFSCSHIYDLWSVSKENVSKAITESSNYLNWLFESEDEVRSFKKENFLNIILEEKNCYFLQMNQMNFEIIDDFLIWCLCTQDELKWLKNEFLKYVFYHCLQYIQGRQLDLARKLVEWAIESEDERKNFISKLFSKDRHSKDIWGRHILTVKYFIGVHNEIPNGPPLTEKETIEIFKEFIEYWVKPMTDKDTFKKQLLRWKGQSEKREDADSEDSYYEDDESSTEQYDSDHTDYRDFDFIVKIKLKNLNLFLNLFSSMCDV